MYRLQPIVRVISLLYFHKTTMCFSTSFTVVCNFDALPSNNKDPQRWMGCWETLAACSSCECSWCFNESECAKSLSFRVTANVGQKSQWPQGIWAPTNESVSWKERTGGRSPQQACHSGRIHQQGTCWDQPLRMEGHCSDKQEHQRANDTTKWHTSH